LSRLSCRAAAYAGTVDQRVDLGLAAPVSCTWRGGHGGDANIGRRTCNAWLQQRQTVATRRRRRTVPSPRGGRSHTAAADLSDKRRIGGGKESRGLPRARLAGQQGRGR